MESAAVIALVATFGAGFYAGAWYMNRLAEKAIDRAFEEWEKRRV